MEGKAWWFLGLLVLAAGCGSISEEGGSGAALENMELREKFLNSPNQILAYKVVVVLPLGYRDEVALTGDRIVSAKKEDKRMTQTAFGRARVYIRGLEIIADRSIEIVYEDKPLPQGRIAIFAEGQVTHVDTERALRGMKTLEIINGTMKYTGKATVQKIK